ncbi:MAG: hypothetical protein ACRDQ2_09705 [Gaiellales bacterium]
MRLYSKLVLVALVVLATACGTAADPPGGELFLSVGDRAPDFALPSASGGDVALADFMNHKPVLLYFSMGPG